MKNAINWFEIPANDFDRAKKFYETVLACQTTLQEMGPMKMAFFPADQQGVSGAICTGNGNKPSQEGTLVYLNADGIMDEALERVTKAGGKVVVPKQLITEEYGHMAVIIDTEGNKVALHAPKR